MSIITYNTTPERGVSSSVSLNKSELASISSVSNSTYYSDSTNWKMVICFFRSTNSRQRTFVTFDATQENPTSSFEVSEKSRGDFIIDSVLIKDFDGGIFQVIRGELNTDDFDVILTQTGVYDIDAVASQFSTDYSQSPYGINFLSDGSIIITGANDNTTSELNKISPDGVLDTSFNSNSGDVSIYSSYGVTNSIAVDSNDNIYVIAYDDIGNPTLKKFSSTGVEDTNFYNNALELTAEDPFTFQRCEPSCLKILPASFTGEASDKLIFGASIPPLFNPGDIPRMGGILGLDGFGANITGEYGMDGTVKDIAFIDSSLYLIGVNDSNSDYFRYGDYTQAYTTSGVLIFDSSGSFDEISTQEFNFRPDESDPNYPDFGPPYAYLDNFDSNIEFMEVDSSGNIYVGGYFNSYRGDSSYNYLMKFDSSWTPDATFSANYNSYGFPQFVSIEVLASGRIAVNNGAAISVHESNGLEVTSAVYGLGGTPAIQGFAKENEEALFVLGEFTSFDGDANKAYLTVIETV